MGNKVKLTPEQIEENMKLLEEAKAFARLDNQAQLPDDVLILFDKRAYGEISHEEMIKLLTKKYSKN